MRVSATYQKIYSCTLSINIHRAKRYRTVNNLRQNRPHHPTPNDGSKCPDVIKVNIPSCAAADTPGSPQHIPCEIQPQTQPDKCPHRVTRLRMVKKNPRHLRVSRHRSDDVTPNRCVRLQKNIGSPQNVFFPTTLPRNTVNSSAHKTSDGTYLFPQRATISSNLSPRNSSPHLSPSGKHFVGDEP